MRRYVAHCGVFVDGIVTRQYAFRFFFNTNMTMNRLFFSLYMIFVKKLWVA